MGNTSTVYLDVEDGAALTVSGVVYINQKNGARGVITQTGGTVSFTTSGNGDIRIGHWPNATYPSRYDISGGSLSIPNTTTYVGWDGRGEMNISGGEVSLKGLSLSNSGNGRGVFTLRGGTLNIGEVGIVRNKRGASGPASAEVYLGQGTIHATANQTWGSNLTMSLYGRSADDTADVAGGVTTFNVDEGKTITIPSVISGVGALTKTGAGTLTLSGANTYTGATTISAGTLELTGNGTLGTGAVTDNGTLKFNYSGDKTLSNSITGTGVIVKEGTNRVKLDNALSYSGDMTINGGTVALYVYDSKQFKLTNLSGSGDLEVWIGGPTNGRDVQFSNLVNDGFTGYISLNQDGAANGNKIATNGKNYDGFKFKVNDGTSIFIYNGEFNADTYISGNGNSENRGTLRIASSVSGKITVMADANIGFDGNNTVSGAISSGAASGESTLFINGKTDGTTVTANRTAGTFSGAVSDGNSGSKLGIRIVSNTITFSGDLSYTGATTVNASTAMTLSGANANLKSSRAVTLNGNLNFSNYTGSDAMKLNDLSGTTAASTITGTDKNLILNNNSNTSYAGTINLGSGTVAKNGTGTLTLGGNVKTTGEITVSDRTLALTAPGAVQNSSAIANNSAITASADQTFKNLSGNGTVTFSNNGYLTLSNSAQTAFSGSITGLKGLTVSGTGALDLSSATISPVAEFETKAGANVNISSEKPVSVSNTFRQNDSTVFTFSGGTASISGANAAQQATIALNGGTMSFNYQAPTLPDYAGLAVHLDASNANSFDNSSSITRWNNLADPDNYLTFTGYGGSTSHAYVTEAKQNGLNVMTFPTNGTAYYDMQSVVNGKTFFAVMADNGKTSSSAYSFLFANKDGVSIPGHNTYCFHRNTGTKLWNTTHLDGNIKNGGVTTLNGTAVDNASADIGTGWNVLSIQATGDVPVSAISRERTGLTQARGWRGDIAEVLVFTEILTDEQVKAVNQYLATKWNVGADVITVPTTDSFVSANEINVVADSTIDVGEFTSVTFGSTTIDEGKKLTISVAQDQSTAWESSISGKGGLTKSGTGTLTLSEAPAYTGATTVEAGTLALSEDGTLNNLSGGSLNPDGSIAQSATLDATGKDLTLTNTDGETNKFIGSITANNLVVDGEGTLQIYTGAEGKVDVQSLVVSSGNLDLKGYMSGSIVVESDTVFSPGNSVGEATFTGSFTLEDAATLLIEQDATGMDKLTASSYVIDPNSILELTADSAAPGGTYAIIVQKDGDNPVNFVDLYATDDFWNSLLTPESDYYWNLSVRNNVVYATMDSNAVPEPSTWALLVLGVIVLFLRKRVRS